MANLAATYWATAAGANSFSGLDLANAAKIDPNLEGDIWTIINAGTVVEPVTIKLCGGAPIGAAININKDATGDFPITVQGRNAGDTADALVTIDANDGAYDVFTLTTADFWVFNDIEAANNSEGFEVHGFEVTANADNVSFNRCKANHCAKGWSFGNGAVGAHLHDCVAEDNASTGFSGIRTNPSLLESCISRSNVTGFFQISVAVGCIANNNTGDGFGQCENLSHCTAYANGADGFVCVTNGRANWTDCISNSNTSDGFLVNDGWTFLTRCAAYGNGGSDINGSNYTGVDMITLTADPFIDAASEDFRLTVGSGGGDELRGVAHALIDGSTISYRDIGAVQHADVATTALRPGGLRPQLRG